MSQIQVKVYGPTDGSMEIVDKIAALLAEEEPERFDVLRSDIRTWFTPAIPGEKITIVAEEQTVEGNPLVGVVRFWKTPYCDDIWLIEGLQVSKSRRREGIGLLLEQYGIELMRQRGEESVSANISRRNLASIRLHEKLGFQCMSTGSKDSYGNYNERTDRYTLIFTGAKG